MHNEMLNFADMLNALPFAALGLSTPMANKMRVRSRTLSRTAQMR
jgi:hypothetical protein